MDKTAEKKEKKATPELAHPPIKRVLDDDGKPIPGKFELCDINRNDYFVAKTGKFKGAKVRYEILFPVPATEEIAKQRYDTDFAGLIRKGLQPISHGVAYSVLFENKDDVYSEELHCQLQELANAYRPGQTKTGAGAQKTAEAAAGRAVQDKASALGFDNVEDMYAVMDKLKKKGKLK